MSKLADAIRAVETGRRIPVPEPTSPVFVAADSRLDTVQPWTEALEYRVGAVAEVRIVVTRQERDQLAAAVQAAKRDLVEHIFGEFRLGFRRINRALWERNFDAAQTAVAEMERSMFEF